MKKPLIDVTTINTSYDHHIDKDDIPVCNILGVNIAAIDMDWLLKYIDENIKLVSGDYICVSNVHTTVTSYLDKSYLAVQNNGLMALPDGGPLASLAKRRGYRSTQRTTGPSFMGEIFKISYEKGYRHFFYGSTQKTLDDLKANLEEEYPGINIVGMYSPPFRPLTEDEDIYVTNLINEANADFVWVGLGAPKQEIWMAKHQGKIKGLMVGVGAGFDFYSGNLHRAPIWMQELNLEWLYRLWQDPKRLFKRYFCTNLRYLWDAVLLRKRTIAPKVKHEKQTVLIVHNYYKIPGGEDTVVANEKKLLEDHGHKVYLYTRHNNELDHMSKLKIVRKTIFNFSTFKEIRCLIKEKGIDIVHVHNTLSIVSPAVYYAARSKRVPVVQTIHNFRFLCPNALFYREGHICEECLKYGLRRAIKYACYRDSVFQTIAVVLNMKIHRATGIYKKINYICLTEFNKQKLLSLKQIRSEKVFIKPNFADKNQIIEECTQNQFVFVGRLDKLKGIRFLLKAWKKYETNGGTSNLIICGMGPEDGWCRDFIKANKLKHVVMKGFMPNEEARKVIAQSKALILPTQWYEGFPMTIVEAYSVGTPVITTDIGNASDLVEDGVTGWKFTNQSIDALCDLLGMLDNSEVNRKVIMDMYSEKYLGVINYYQLESIYARIK